MPEQGQPPHDAGPGTPTGEVASIEGCKFTSAGRPLLAYLRRRYPHTVNFAVERQALLEHAKTLTGVQRDAALLAGVPAYDHLALNALMRRGFVRNTAPGVWRATSQAEALAYRQANPPAGLTGHARQVWINTGMGVREQTELARQRDREPRERAQRTIGHVDDREAADTGFQEAAAAGNPISQRLSPQEVAQIRAQLRRIVPSQGPAAILSALRISEAQLREFVHGKTTARDLPAEARTAIADLTSALESHQLWSRKVAAGVWGLYRQDGWYRRGRLGECA